MTLLLIIQQEQESRNLSPNDPHCFDDDVSN